LASSFVFQVIWAVPNAPGVACTPEMAGGVVSDGIVALKTTSTQ
jgi:hypothetical protein